MSKYLDLDAVAADDYELKIKYDDIDYGDNDIKPEKKSEKPEKKPEKKSVERHRSSGENRRSSDRRDRSADRRDRDRSRDKRHRHKHSHSDRRRGSETDRHRDYEVGRHKDRYSESKRKSDNVKEVKPVETEKESEIELEEEEILMNESDEERLIEERRKKRKLIMEKYNQSVETNSSLKDPSDNNMDQQQNVKETQQEQDSNMDSETDKDEINAANFDPNSIQNEDDEKKHQNAVLEKISRHVNNAEIVVNPVDNDVDEDDDLFAPVTIDLKTAKKNLAAKAVIRTQGSLGLSDNWDDEEGYYRLIIGELLHDKYQVLSSIGKGVFSSVVRARDLTKSGANSGADQVAIKIIRSNDIMYKAGLKELGILKKLHDLDPEGKKHCVKNLGSFEHKGHLCIIFESLKMNLREVLKKYGNNKGLNIKAVRVYSQQLFLSLSLLRKAEILHADIKPDNMLVNEKKTILKLADFGSAGDSSENDITPYLVSRYYRAPEIMLGLPYDYGIDIWSIACTLYELYTGRILFPGKDNNQMIKLMMDLKGRFPAKTLRRGQFSHVHFDLGADGNDASIMFIETIHDSKLAQKTTKRVVLPNKPTRDLKSRLLGDDERQRMTEDEVNTVTHFIDLLEKCLVLNPEKRLTVKEALVHPFINRSS